MKSFLLVLLISFGLIALLEGTASIGFMILEWKHSPSTATIPLKERMHTEFDPIIGWKGSPSVSIPDIYGPGTVLTTNSMGFRNSTETSLQKPKAMRRAICSGDSFTLGFRVSDHETWCHLLSKVVPHLETVNMGQGGYGIDQSYLWYKQAGEKLESDIHVFAFIADDFRRIQNSSFFNYPKPFFKMEKGQAILRNTPLKDPSSQSEPHRSLRDSLRMLRLFQWLQAGGPGPAASQETETSSDEALEIALTLFRELQARSTERGRELLLVYLPSGQDLYDKPTQIQRERLSGRIHSLSIHYLDLFDKLQKLPKEKIYNLFFMKYAEKNPESLDHYNYSGNLWVANQIKDSVQALLSESGRHVPLTPKEKLANGFKTDRGIHGVR